jgi:hypothetical protein
MVNAVPATEFRVLCVKMSDLHFWAWLPLQIRLGH